MKKGLRWRDITNSKSYKVSNSTPPNDNLHLSVRTTSETLIARVYADKTFVGELGKDGLTLSFESIPKNIEIIPIEGSGIISRAKLEVGTRRTAWVPAKEDGGVFIVESYELYDKLNKGEWYTLSGEYPPETTSGSLILGTDQETYTIHPTKHKTFKPSKDIDKKLTIALYDD